MRLVAMLVSVALMGVGGMVLHVLLMLAIASIIVLLPLHLVLLILRVIKPLPICVRLSKLKTLMVIHSTTGFVKRSSFTTGEVG